MLGELASNEKLRAQNGHEAFCMVCYLREATSEVIPAEFQDRFHYDAGKHRLVYRGFMSKAEYDRLFDLSHDLAYLDALQELFILSTYATATTSRRAWLWLAIGLVAALAVLLITYLRKWIH